MVLAIFSKHSTHMYAWHRSQTVNRPPSTASELRPHPSRTLLRQPLMGSSNQAAKMVQVIEQ